MMSGYSLVFQYLILYIGVFNPSQIENLIGGMIPITYSRLKIYFLFSVFFLATPGLAYIRQSNSDRIR